MAALDSSKVLSSHGAAAITISDGAGSPSTITLKFEGAFSWEETGRSVTEARDRGRRKTTPNIIETGDNDISITLDGLITSYLGSSAAHVYEAMTKTGNSAPWVSTTDGSGYCFKLVYTAYESDSGTSQALTFNFCHADTISVDPTGDDGKSSFSASITCYQNRPAIA